MLPLMQRLCTASRSLRWLGGRPDVHVYRVQGGYRREVAYAAAAERAQADTAHVLACLGPRTSRRCLVTNSTGDASTDNGEVAYKVGERRQRPRVIYWSVLTAKCGGY